MTQHAGNSGFINYGTASIQGSAIGPGAVVNNLGREQREARRTEAAIGVLTVLPVEAAAVRDELGLHPAPEDPSRTDLGTVRTGGREVTVAAARALGQGQEAAAIAVARLRARYRPAVVVLAGIAGAIHPLLREGDVVVATRVISYDLRKETPAGTIRRGRELQAPASAGRAAGQFFTAHGDPALLRGSSADGAFRVHDGPIGSGNAVIADEESAIRDWLRHYNDKILAVDMEAAGFATACHDDPDGSPPPPWLVVRGISDRASSRKNDDFHQVAAGNAARTLSELLSYLSYAVREAP